tara:strand:- start:1387 stop:1761 length:375 start_codon:yes stop_codon:yes gene_type:complete
MSKKIDCNYEMSKKIDCKIQFEQLDKLFNSIIYKIDNGECPDKELPDGMYYYTAYNLMMQLVDSAIWAYEDIVNDYNIDSKKNHLKWLRYKYTRIMDMMGEYDHEGGLRPDPRAYGKNGEEIYE